MQRLKGSRQARAHKIWEAIRDNIAGPVADRCLRDCRIARGAQLHTVTLAPNLPTIRSSQYCDSDNKFKVTIRFREPVYVISPLN